jgi:predicted SAM-dependent methyltransferase
MKLNLGSGGKPLKGYVNVDSSSRAPGVDKIVDLDTMPWPFADDSSDEIVMDNCLEHLVNHTKAMQEIHRILKPGCTAIITVPHFTWQLAFADPTHRHFFAYPTFFYFAGHGGYNEGVFL